MRWPVVIMSALAAVLALGGVVAQFSAEPRQRWWVMALGLTLALFLIPAISGSDALAQGNERRRAADSGAVCRAGAGEPCDRVYRRPGYAADRRRGHEGLFGVERLQIVVPESGWNYESYETLDDALAAVQRGEISRGDRQLEDPGGAPACRHQ